MGTVPMGSQEAGGHIGAVVAEESHPHLPLHTRAHRQIHLAVKSLKQHSCLSLIDGLSGACMCEASLPRSLLPNLIPTGLPSFLMRKSGIVTLKLALYAKSLRSAEMSKEERPSPARLPHR